MATRFKLPPLEGDDMAMRMERDMLRRWGFLGPPNKMAGSQKNIDSPNSNDNGVIHDKHQQVEEGAKDKNLVENSKELSTNKLDDNAGDDNSNNVKDNDEKKKCPERVCKIDDVEEHGISSTSISEDRKAIGVPKKEDEESIAAREATKVDGFDFSKEITPKKGKSTGEISGKAVTAKSTEEVYSATNDNTVSGKSETEGDTERRGLSSTVSEDNKTLPDEKVATMTETAADCNKEANEDINSSDGKATEGISDNAEKTAEKVKYSATSCKDVPNKPQEIASEKEIGTELNKGDNKDINSCDGKATEGISDNAERTAEVKSSGTNSNAVPDKLQEMTGEVLVLYNEACQHYEKEEHCECLLSVEEALELCGCGSGGGGGVEKDEDGDADDGGGVDTTQLWLLRSKVMNSMENYREALKSAYKVHAKIRPSRLWVEGAIAMEKLGIQATAELWISMALHLWSEEASSNAQELGNAAADNDVMYVLKMMQSRLRVERIYGPLVKDKPIRVMASIKYNRTVHATKKIKKGDIIFQELPEIFEQSVKTHHVTACAECAKSLLQPEDLFCKDGAAAPNLNAEVRKGLKKIWPKRNVVNCSFCREVKYCSEQCRKKSWNTHHKVICPSIAESTAAMLYDVRRSFRDVMAADGSSWQGWWNTEFSPTLISRMTAMVLCKANLLADLRAKESYSDAHWSMCEAILEKYSSCEKIKAAKDIPKMQELLNNLFKRSKFLRYDVTPAVFNKTYSQAATNTIKFHDTTHPMNYFAERIKAENENSNKLYKKIIKNYGKSLDKPSIAEFHGLFPLGSCLNHSCFPNAEIESAEVEAQSGIIVKTVRDVKVGDEIVVSYVDPLMERHERRKLLWSKYKFVCECPRCIHEGLGPHMCTNCGKNIKNTPTNHSDMSGKKENGNELCTPNDNVVNNKDTQHTSDKAHDDKVMSEENSSTPKGQITQKPNNGDGIVDNANTDAEDTNYDVSISEKDTNNEASVSETSSSPVAKIDLKESETRDVSSDSQISENNKVSISSDNNSLSDGVQTSNGNISSSNSDVNIRQVEETLEIEPNNKLNTEPNNDPSSMEPKNEPNSTSSESGGTTVFPACSRCKRAWYCSVDCQKESWTKGHKKICTKR